MPLPLVYHPHYVTPLPEGHRFPMPKFGILYRLLLEEGVAQPGQFFAPEIASPELLSRVHEPEYVRAFCEGSLPKQAVRRIGLPWSEGLVLRTCTAVGGTLLTARLALKFGLACNTAGGTHHAFPGFGAGFCIFNDLAVAAQTLFLEGEARRILIVDLDVHQGDGTAWFFRDNPAIFTFSVHAGNNFPFRKQNSDFDIALPDSTGTAVYLETLADMLPQLLDRFAPDLVLYDAGVDVHREDLLGRFELDDAGIEARDALVIAECRRRGVPVACVIGGGYDRDHLVLARRHSILHRVASRFAV